MNHVREVEELLERFSPRPAPSGLKGRTVHAAEQKVRETRLLSQGWRWVLAGSLVLLALFILADWRCSALEENRLSASSGLPGQEFLSAEEKAEEKAAELLASLPDLDAASKELVRRVFLDKERGAGRYPRPDRRFTEEIHEY